MSANAPISDTGIVTSGISVARQVRRNRKITSTTSSTASPMVAYTDLIEASMNTAGVVGHVDLHALRQPRGDARDFDPECARCPAGWRWIV